MAKLAVLFLACLAFQAAFAGLEMSGEDSLVKYLNEGKEFTVFLRHDFPEQRNVFKTITTRFQRYATMVEEIINKLREESFIKYHDETKSVKPVMQMLDEIYTILKKVSLYSEMTDKKTFVVDFEALFERVQELVNITYTTFPEFRFTLKYLIVDFMTTLHEIRTYSTYTKTTEFVPSAVVMKIREYTRECTEMIKEFSHPTQMKVALRGYLRYVREILHKLEVETLLGDKEFDVLMHTLTNKLRDIVFPLMQITETSEFIDVKMIKNDMITRFFQVVEIFEEMTRMMEVKHMPTEVKIFVDKMFNYYYYALEMIYNQMKYANKVGFFAPEFYNTEYYNKYGYGLYEKSFEKLYLTPFTYKTESYSLFPTEYVKTPRYEMNFYKKDFESFETPKEYFVKINTLLKEFLVKFETVDMREFQYYVKEFVQVLDAVYEELRPIHKEESVREFFYFVKHLKMYFEQMPVESMRVFFITSLKMFTEQFYRLATVEKFEDIFFMYTNYLKKVFSYKYAFFTEGKTYNKDFLNKMHTFTSKIYEVKDFKTMPMTMYMHQFVSILEQVIEVMYKHIDYKYENKMVREMYFNLKQMKSELEHYMHFGGVMSSTYKMRFVQYIKYFSMEMEKMMTVEEFPMVVMKELYMRYIAFLQKFYFEASKYSIEYPVKSYSTMYHTKTMMPYYFDKFMQY